MKGVSAISLGRLFLVLSLIAAGCDDPPVTEVPVDDADIASGGGTTVYDAGSNAFSTPAPNLSAESLEKHLAGDAEFEQVFVTPPATVNPGLGPTYNNVSCISCHPRDGRGRPPLPGEPLGSMLLRISLPGTGDHGGPLPVDGFGTQLQTKAVIGSIPEGDVLVSWTEEPGEYPDGTPYSLRRPSNVVTGSVPGGILVSARVAPAVFGLGLLEAVAEETILMNADEADMNGDGISGKANYAWNAESGQMEVGRFGWKASTPTLLQQSAGAYNEDMGVTTPYFPLEHCHGNTGCDTLANDPEVDDEILQTVGFYVQTLGVPARRNTDNPSVIQGKKIFAEIGCNGCHQAPLRTGSFPVGELSNQTIYPYTDLLLHDMGPDLADGRPDFLANGSEWRTAPLWGIGLTEVVSGHTYFLHDGRARSIEEAILWHGGEAGSSKERFRVLTREDRSALMNFLMSL